MRGHGFSFTFTPDKETVQADYKMKEKKTTGTWNSPGPRVCPWLDGWDGMDRELVEGPEERREERRGVKDSS